MLCREQQCRKKSQPMKIKVVKDVNEDETLVLNLAREVIQVNQRGKCSYKTLRNITERTYRCTFHLQYKNQSTDSKNQVIYKLQESFPGQWLMQHVRFAMENNYNNKTQ